MMQLTLIRKRHVTDTIWSFEFSPAQAMHWEPGQFIKVAVAHNGADTAGTMRFFTIASAPHEEIIRLVTRSGRSSFKRALFELLPGNAIRVVDMPAGNVVWGASQQPRILVASGVGITPFYAMLKAQTQQGMNTPVHLIYFHPRTTLPFAAEFNAWSRKHPLLTISQVQAAYTPELLNAIDNNLSNSLIYLSGPMQSTRLMLPPWSIPARQIIQDTFTGYAATDY